MSVASLLIAQDGHPPSWRKLSIVCQLQLKDNLVGSSPCEQSMHSPPSTFPRATKRLEQFIEGLPKVELHVHLEGTITAEQRRKFAKRNGMPEESPVAGWEYDASTTDPAAYLRKFLTALFDG